jgi:hypothetical protein
MADVTCKVAIVPRSNWFQVKDDAAFEKWDILLAKYKRGDTWAISPGEDDDGEHMTWEYERYDEELEEEVQIDFFNELAQHLRPGSVAILFGALRDSGYYDPWSAIAVHSDGRVLEIGDMEQLIRNKVSADLNVPVQSIGQYASPEDSERVRWWEAA